MANLIVDKFDFISSQCGWTVNTERAVWKGIALMGVHSGSCTEEDVLFYLTGMGQASEDHEKKHGPGTCNDLTFS